MTEIRFSKVETKRDRRRFLTFPWKVYKHDSLWVPPLVPERMKVIDPETGAFFKRGEAEFFLVWRGRELVGTVCAAEDIFTNESRGSHDCMFGFLEFVEDYAVFEAIVTHLNRWARDRSLDTLFGPFHLDYEDGYGILVSGRDRPPTMMCGHTPPYYLDFFERAGFTPARAANLAFAIDFNNSEQLQRLSRLADRLRQRGWLSIRQVNWDDWQGEIDRVHMLLGEALAWAEDGIPWHRDQLEAMVEPFRQIADPELILFVEADGKTVGWFPGVPNLNEAFIHANGLRYPWDYLKLLYHMRKQPKCVAVKSVLVLPEYQKRGAAVLLFDEMAKRASAKGYEWADFSITSEDNPDTPDLADTMGAYEYKRWQVYNKKVE